ncbi:MAG TPA: hypothetical protein VML75_23695 [Kofleriaceae bacterium]|nr:hypothetical protein [Kofleriaceae bacterium]
MGRLSEGFIALALLTLSAASAIAQPRLTVVAGTSRGGDGQLVPTSPSGSNCAGCAFLGGGTGMPATNTEAQLATLAVGIIGTEGRIRGGGELFTILGVGSDRTSGYTAVVTYAGLDSGRVFTHGGLGVGSYWGAEHATRFDALAGNLRGEVGLHVHPSWIVVGRGDLIVNQTSASPVLTLALEWIPGGR